MLSHFAELSYTISFFWPIVDGSEFQEKIFLHSRWNAYLFFMCFDLFFGDSL